MTDIEKMSIAEVLLRGKNVRLNGLTLKNYKLSYIFDEIGLINYYALVSICNFTNVEIFTEENNILHLKDFLNKFTDKSWEYLKEQQLLYTNNDDIPIVIGMDNIQFIIDIFKMMYCVNKVERDSERNDINDEMKELLKEFEEEENKVHKAKGIGNITLFGIIKGVSCKHPSINLINIWDYTMYQLMSSFNSLDKIDNESRIMGAVYNGIIDNKKIKQETIHWATDSTN